MIKIQTKQLALALLIIFGVWGFTQLALPVGASGTIYVDINNNGFEDGSQAYPFNSIQEGIEYASSGDTILVLPGIYAETILLPRPKPGLILRSQSGPSITIIDGQSQASVITIMDSATIDGFTIRNGGGGLSYIHNGYGIVVDANNSSAGMLVDIRNNIITQNNVRGGIGFTGNTNYINVSATISYNRIYGNSGLAGYVGGGISLEIEGGSPGTINIYNNLIYSNIGYTGGGLKLGYSTISTINVINNTVYNNTAQCGGGTSATSTGLSYINNIFFGNTASEGNDFCLTLPALVSHNIIGDGQFVGSNGNLAEDPLVVNAGMGDFHLQSSSPAIDSGTPVFVVDDFEGDVRPNDGTCRRQWDIGADEYYSFVEELNSYVPVPSTTASLLFSQISMGLYSIYLPIIVC